MHRIPDFTNDSQPRSAPSSIPDVMDELAAHFPVFCKLAYRDRETAQAVATLAYDLVESYASIDLRIDGGVPAYDQALMSDQAALAWDIKTIRDLAARGG